MITPNEHVQILYFEHNELAQINGEPTFATLHCMLLQLKVNTSSVPTELGRGTNGFVGIIMSPATYITIAPMIFSSLPCTPEPSLFPLDPRSTRLRISRHNMTSAFIVYTCINLSNGRWSSRYSRWSIPSTLRNSAIVLPTKYLPTSVPSYLSSSKSMEISRLKKYAKSTTILQVCHMTSQSQLTASSPQSKTYAILVNLQVNHTVRYRLSILVTLWLVITTFFWSDLRRWIPQIHVGKFYWLFHQ